MSVRTRAIFMGQAVGTGVAQVLGTCPADRVGIVKESAVSVTGAAGAVFIGTRRSGAFVTITIADSAGPANVSELVYRVVQEGDELVMFAPLGAVVTWWLSGSLLDGDAA